MVLTEFPEAQRNKQGDYGKALSRLLLSEEIVLLFQRQRELGRVVVQVWVHPDDREKLARYIKRLNERRG